MKTKIFIGLFILLCTTAYAASTTTNYSLYKPVSGDTGWADSVNTNFDTIDTQLKTNYDLANNHANDDSQAHADYLTSTTTTFTASSVQIGGRVELTSYASEASGSLIIGSLTAGSPTTHENLIIDVRSTSNQASIFTSTGVDTFFIALPTKIRGTTTLEGLINNCILTVDADGSCDTGTSIGGDNSIVICAVCAAN